MTIPDRLAPSGWVEHVPFAMWLVSVLRPRLFVELGTYHGTSYCGFCQAIASIGLPTRAFAVDTWEGDPHAGALGPESLADLKSHHDLRYQGFSTLLQMTFDEAACRFSDGEIDLLHIDGYHTYEAVRHDYETWKSRVSNRGVILFHDVTEKSRDFGVWKFWDELKIKYPSFTFEHEHGLGVLATGSELPEEIRTLMAMPENQADSVRAFFEMLGNRIRLQMELDSTRAEREAAADSFQQAMASCNADRDVYIQSFHHAMASYQTVEAMVQEARQQLHEERASSAALAQEVAALSRELEHLRNADTELRHRLTAHQDSIAEFHASTSWRLTHRIATLGRFMAPPGTRRRRVLKQVIPTRHVAQGL